MRRDLIPVAALFGPLTPAVAGDPRPAPHQGEKWSLSNLPHPSLLRGLTPGSWIGLPFEATAEALRGTVKRATAPDGGGCVKWPFVDPDAGLGATARYVARCLP